MDRVNQSQEMTPRPVESSIKTGIADTPLFFVVPHVCMILLVVLHENGDTITRAHSLSIRLT